jgi:rhamnopyranosyl-N-acetylglucosaminyl-diphospho-decaprenol beta-1,3/1,4-galactofuranosyltransferase
MNQNQGVPSVAAVVVTYNRLALLKECVAALRSQSRAVDEIIVIDNGSTDGSADWLAMQSGLHVIRQPNQGSSGGQFAGVKAAYERGHNWFWCMDDDTIPDPKALAAFCRTPPFRDGSAGFLASVLIYPNGEPQPSPYVLESPESWITTAGRDCCVRARSSTFVSVMVSRPAVRSQGLPVKEFFLIWDDVEFTERITRRYPGYFVLDSIAVHKTPDLGNPGHSTSSKKFGFHQRNRVIYLRLQPIAWWKKAYRLTKWIVRDLLLIVSLRFRPIHLMWTLSGIFIPAAIEYPDQQATAADIAARNPNAARESR